ncbi:DUF3536 domain-containing protein [candidate division KSB1 bacterium]|nr:DUF3536 domain-containing protein [candidate division KSB1 bacterium]
MSDKSNYLIIHGHFYQPPRENPWIEAIERQPSASPYHDWNDRISAECYTPNSMSRIMGGNQYRIVDIVNNYERISFNFGPTLMSWLKAKAQETYQAIIDGDRRSRELFSGHGNAIAQGYNHTILPLSNERDKYTQLKWGIEDFKMHFGREPESIWLPETAVNYSTLKVLIELGIKFIILSPHQAQRVRPLKAKEQWKDVGGGDIDTSQSYRCYFIDQKGKKHKNKYIDIFFYHGDLSKRVAFEHLLKDGKNFAQEIRKCYLPKHEGPQLVSIATDGESYGHHEPFGDMGLAFLVHRAAENSGMTLTNYGEYLEKFPPKMEVELKPGPNGEGTAWSCSHGVGRWYRDCGCSTGGPFEWNQQWRSPLRTALDQLRDELIIIFEEKGAHYFKDPWDARNEYIHIILDRSKDSMKSFFQKHAKYELSENEISEALNLLEMQRHAMLMYTSCGWFFAEISGLEATQVLKYAARAIELGNKFSNQDLELKFVAKLDHAKSNFPKIGTGKDIYYNMIKPYVVTPKKLVNHYAILTAINNGNSDLSRVYNYEIKRKDYEKKEGEHRSLTIGRLEVHSDLTKEREDFAFVLLYRSNKEYRAVVSEMKAVPDYEQTKANVIESFEKNENSFWENLIRQWGQRVYSVADILYEEREKLYRLLLKEKLDKLSQDYWNIYQENKHIIFELNDQHIPIPVELKLPVELGLSPRLEEEIKLSIRDYNFDKAREIVQVAERLDLHLYKDRSQQFFQQTLEEKIRAIYHTLSRQQADEMLLILEIVSNLKLNIKETIIQNYIFKILREKVTPMIEDILEGDAIDHRYYFISSILQIAFRLNFDISKYKQALKTLEQKLSNSPDYWP